MHLNKTAALRPKDRIWRNQDDDFIPGVSIGGEYFVDVEEDEVAEAAIVRTVYKAASTEAEDVVGGKRKEGCSCLYGNPCAESEFCENWQGRFEVAKVSFVDNVGVCFLFRSKTNFRFFLSLLLPPTYRKMAGKVTHSIEIKNKLFLYFVIIFRKG